MHVSQGSCVGMELALYIHTHKGNKLTGYECSNHECNSSGFLTQIFDNNVECFTTNKGNRTPNSCFP